MRLIVRALSHWNRRKIPTRPQLFQQAANAVGYKPYNLPSANTSGPYTNPYGAQMGPCNFCGFCSGYVCYMYSKASPNVNILPALKQVPNFELRPNSHVLKVNLDSTKSKATGVTYIDARGVRSSNRRTW